MGSSKAEKVADNGESKAKEKEVRINSFHHVVVVVLGDVGRSPRMQYHTLSLLEHGYQVTLVGYEGEDLIPSLHDHRNSSINGSSRMATTQEMPGHLNVLRFQPFTPSTFIRTKLKPLYYLIRLVELFRLIMYTLFTKVSTPVQCVLVQNPPSVPLLLVSYLFCRWTEASFLIDWHNLGYTMFDVSDLHPLRRIVKFYEHIMAKRADGHLCVTRAMQDFLSRPPFSLAKAEPTTLPVVAGPPPTCSISIPTVQVLYDRPPKFFHKTTQQERAGLMTRLQQKIRTQQKETPDLLSFPCTFPTQDIIKPDGERSTFLIMSCTSWTADEDFGILLDALVRLSETMTKKKGLPKVAVVVTGKGPQKSYYQSHIKQLRPTLVNMTIDTLWLESGDYPLLLGCADVGVSLHTSTSGLDLPIKIYDMFGCHVPVCAMNFKCLREVMRHNWNGTVFSNSEELAEQLEMFAHDFSNAKETLNKMANHITTMNRWNEEWDECAYPVIRRLCRHSDELHWTGASRRRIFSFLSLLALFIAMVYFHFTRDQGK
jgi:beta-1,4-mannosyltransferase